MMLIKCLCHVVVLLFIGLLQGGLGQCKSVSNYCAEALIIVTNFSSTQPGNNTGVQ